MAKQVARYHSIADDLRLQINQGKLAPGEKLPSEEELTTTYDVSRNTVRLALGRLTDEGLLVSAQGRGTFVRERYEPAVWNWTTLESRSVHEANHTAGDQWASQIAANGQEPRQEIRVSIRRPPEEVALQLQLDPTTALTVVRERIRYVDHEPYALADSYFPEGLVRDTPLMLPEDVSAPGGVLASAGLIQVRYSDEITVRMPTREESERLVLPAATPVAVHRRTGYDKDGKPLRVMITTLPGDRHVIRYDVSTD